jgi:thiosulfate/3-mercaptopyruvate sulfurtransferase
MKMVLCALLATQVLAQDPWAAKDLMQPRELAARLQAKNQPSATILFVGFPMLYHGAHIPGAILLGPCSKAEGLEALRKAVRDLPREQEIILYCGCCPFVKCPNVRPAYSALHELHFSHVKVLFVETNLHTDWVEKGYPVEKGG